MCTFVLLLYQEGSWRISEVPENPRAVRWVVFLRVHPFCQPLTAKSTRLVSLHQQEKCAWDCVRAVCRGNFMLFLLLKANVACIVDLDISFLP